jgi:nitrogen fixation protein FixH
MKSTFNPWPLGVVLALVLFGAGTAGLVVLACSQRSDLVRADYYDQEIRHQEQMDRLERTRRIAPETRITYDAKKRRVALSLPETHAQRQPKGQIHLYRPSTAELDRRIPLDLDAAGHQILEADSLEPGLWQVQVSWIVDRDEYYFDQRLVVPPEP